MPTSQSQAFHHHTSDPLPFTAPSVQMMHQNCTLETYRCLLTNECHLNSESHAVSPILPVCADALPSLLDPELRAPCEPLALSGVTAVRQPASCPHISPCRCCPHTPARGGLQTSVSTGPSLAESSQGPAQAQDSLCSPTSPLSPCSADQCLPHTSPRTCSPPSLEPTGRRPWNQAHALQSPRGCLFPGLLWSRKAPWPSRSFQ